MDFSDMGSSWVQVREATVARTLRAGDRGLGDVVSRWDQLLRFAALRLGRDLGTDVQLVLSRRELADPSVRAADLTSGLVERGELIGSLRILDAVGPLRITADLRAGTVTTSVDLDAPREGRPATRVNWLVRQLRDAPGGLRLDAWSMNARASMSELLSEVREDPLVMVDDARRDLRAFRVSATASLGTKRGTGRGSFIDSVLSSVDGFYGTVVQGLASWSPRAPRLPSGGQTATEAAGINTDPPPSDLGHADIDDDARGLDPSDAEPQAAGPADGSAACPWPAPTVDWTAAQTKLDRERVNDLPPPTRDPVSATT